MKSWKQRPRGRRGRVKPPRVRSISFVRNVETVELLRDRRLCGAGQGWAEVAWMGSWKTSQTARMRAMVCALAHSLRPITQLLRFIRPATCTISNRYLLKRAVRSSASRNRPLIARDVVAHQRQLEPSRIDREALTGHVAASHPVLQLIMHVLYRAGLQPVPVQKLAPIPVQIAHHRVVLTVRSVGEQRPLSLQNPQPYVAQRPAVLLFIAQRGYEIHLRPLPQGPVRFPIKGDPPLLRHRFTAALNSGPIWAPMANPIRPPGSALRSCELNHPNNCPSQQALSLRK